MNSKTFSVFHRVISFNLLPLFLSFVMVWTTPCPYSVAVDKSDDQQQHDEATSTSQGAQDDGVTHHGALGFVGFFVGVDARAHRGSRDQHVCFGGRRGHLPNEARRLSKHQRVAAQRRAAVQSAVPAGVEGLELQVVFFHPRLVEVGREGIGQSLTAPVVEGADELRAVVHDPKPDD